MVFLEEAIIQPATVNPKNKNGVWVLKNEIIINETAINGVALTRMGPSIGWWKTPGRFQSG